MSNPDVSRDRAAETAIPTKSAPDVLDEMLAQVRGVAEKAKARVDARLYTQASKPGRTTEKMPAAVQSQLERAVAQLAVLAAGVGKDSKTQVRLDKLVQDYKGKKIPFSQFFKEFQAEVNNLPTRNFGIFPNVKRAQLDKVLLGIAGVLTEYNVPMLDGEVKILVKGVKDLQRQVATAEVDNKKTQTDIVTVGKKAATAQAKADKLQEDNQVLVVERDALVELEQSLDVGFGKNQAKTNELYDFLAGDLQRDIDAVKSGKQKPQSFAAAIERLQKLRGDLPAADTEKNRALLQRIDVIAAYLDKAQSAGLVRNEDFDAKKAGGAGERILADRWKASAALEDGRQKLTSHDASENSAVSALEEQVELMLGGLSALQEGKAEVDEFVRRTSPELERDPQGSIDEHATAAAVVARAQATTTVKTSVTQGVDAKVAEQLTRAEGQKHFADTRQRTAGEELDKQAEIFTNGQGEGRRRVIGHTERETQRAELLGKLEAVQVKLEAALGEARTAHHKVKNAQTTVTRIKQRFIDKSSSTRGKGFRRFLLRIPVIGSLLIARDIKKAQADLRMQSKVLATQVHAIERNVRQLQRHQTALEALGETANTINRSLHTELDEHQKAKGVAQEQQQQLKDEQPKLEKSVEAKREAVHATTEQHAQALADLREQRSQALDAKRQQWVSETRTQSQALAAHGVADDAVAQARVAETVQNAAVLQGLFADNPSYSEDTDALLQEFAATQHAAFGHTTTEQPVAALLGDVHTNVMRLHVSQSPAASTAAKPAPASKAASKAAESVTQQQRQVKKVQKEIALLQDKLRPAKLSESAAQLQRAFDIASDKTVDRADRESAVRFASATVNDMLQYPELAEQKSSVAYKKAVSLSTPLAREAGQLHIYMDGENGTFNYRMHPERGMITGFIRELKPEFATLASDIRSENTLAELTAQLDAKQAELAALTGTQPRAAAASLEAALQQDPALAATFVGHVGKGAKVKKPARGDGKTAAKEWFGKGLALFRGNKGIEAAQTSAGAPTMVPPGTVVS